MSDLSNEVQTITQCFRELSALWKPVMALPLPETLSQLADEDKAQLQVLMAYTMNTLYYVTLKMNGIPPGDHPVDKERARIELYMKKIDDLLHRSQRQTLMF
ncbi:hypothetical protein H4R35_005800 [Dimargaris xerosporica]|nr:hypothetical protein H4R35_005800 [Dimargaris xerosporica]